jgi:hypothetical protein
MTVLNIRTLLAGALALAITPATVVAAQSRKALPQSLDRTTALTAFERIQKLEGTWRSKSTKGWEERQQFRLIAKGTAVASQSMPVPSANAPNGDTAPDAPMLTVFHMDGDRLLLTHYCEAGNQPRMIATALEDGGRTLRFAFLDATNMASSTMGHMDAVAITFLDHNHFDEQWAWYKNGNEQWMETVHNERMPSASGQP